MVTHVVDKIHIAKFWDNEYKNLSYVREPFNDPKSLATWTTQGYSGPFTGWMCDMRYPQPTWNNKFVEIFKSRGWKNVGTSYYRMDTGTILPNHNDLYKKYIELFDLTGKEQQIYRAIVFLENWDSGHYAEYDNSPFVNWIAGDCVIWHYDTVHMAANIGLTPRYTLQITGHV